MIRSGGRPSELQEGIKAILRGAHVVSRYATGFGDVTEREKSMMYLTGVSQNKHGVS